MVKKTGNDSAKALLLDIKREMAKPREAKSARERAAHLAAAQIMQSKRIKTNR